MDTFAHVLWVGAGLTLARRRWPITKRTMAATVALAALPDILHLLPIIGWWAFGDGSLATLWRYGLAVPNSEPGLPPLVALFSHHLHCIMHSAVIAGVATVLIRAVTGSLWIPLLGWWSHIAIDVPTHSADFYPAPILYPFTQWGFDGLAWNTPWFLVLNYAVLAVLGIWLMATRNSATGVHSPGGNK